MPKKEKECPSCAMNIDADENVCPVCGYEFPHQSKVFVTAVVIMILVLVLLIISGLI